MNYSNDFVVQTKNLSKTFGNFQALNSVNLEIPKNSIFGFLGPNGAGKTTLMKILLGLSLPTNGSAKVFGFDIVKDSIAIRERIGYLPQQPRFIEYMTARENLLLSTRFFYIGPKEKIKERCDEMLELVGLEDKADRPIKKFSLGEKQRLGIALAQVNYPDLLILDEPASSLDPIGRKEVFHVMEKLRENTTIFFSTHILDDVQRICDSVAILNRGELVVCGPMHNLLNHKRGIEYLLTVYDKEKIMGKHLSGLEWIIQSEIIQKNSDGSITWRIQLKDSASAERQLLQLIQSDHRFIITEFSKQKTTLEDVFMQIVKGVEYVH